MKTNILKVVLNLALLLAAGRAGAEVTALTYQGRLDDGGSPASGLYDMTFQVWDAASGGATQSGLVGANAVPVTNGLFTVTVDFGEAPFTGAERWLQIRVSTNLAGSFTALTPRQRITATPYAIHAAESLHAADATTLGGQGSGA